MLRFILYCYSLSPQGQDTSGKRPIWDERVFLQSKPFVPYEEERKGREGALRDRLLWCRALSSRLIDWRCILEKREGFDRLLKQSYTHLMGRSGWAAGARSGKNNEELEFCVNSNFLPNSSRSLSLRLSSSLRLLSFTFPLKGRENLIWEKQNKT